MHDGKWDLSFLYTGFDDPAYLRDLDAMNDRIADVRAAAAAEAAPVEKLEGIVAALENLERLMEKVETFTYLHLAADANDTAAGRMMGRLQSMAPEAGLAVSAAERAIAAVEDLEGAIAASGKLRTVAFPLREAREHIAHAIPENVEPWILQMQLSGGTAFSELREKLTANHTVEYRGQQIPLSAVRGLAYDPDARVRKDAFEAEIAGYGRIALPVSYCLNSIKMEARTLAKAHGYGSVLDMTLADSRMDRETLDAMWTAVKEYLPHFRRYLRAKGKLLGHEDGLPFRDLFAPAGSGAKVYTIEDAKETLFREMGKFTPRMAAFMKDSFDHDRIDLYPREGKSGGAFCAPLPGEGCSLVLTNFQGSYSDVSALAHELGHAWHTECMGGLSPLLCHEPMPLAETASIFNETMLAWQVLKTASPETELNLLDASLTEVTQTVVDIYSRYLFESEVIDTREDHVMTVEELNDAMLRAQEASYGDGLAKEGRHPYMWCCKSHYYSSELNFYNFPYAFGELFGKGVFALYLEKGEPFVDEYCRLLRNCGSDTVANVAASVGIDVRSADFWRSSLETVRRQIDRFCLLCEHQA